MGRSARHFALTASRKNTGLSVSPTLLSKSRFYKGMEVTRQLPCQCEASRGEAGGWQRDGWPLTAGHTSLPSQVS